MTESHHVTQASLKLFAFCLATNAHLWLHRMAEALRPNQESSPGSPFILSCEIVITTTSSVYLSSIIP